MGKVIFLLEEPSMKTFLEEFLPRLIPGWQRARDFQCVPHRGKSDLDKSIRIKLKAWREPGVRFVIVRDNDNADCRALKQRLQTACSELNRPETLVRLVCQELESWYLGDPSALERAYPAAGVRTARVEQRYADPDAWQKPSLEIKRMIPQFEKCDGARRLGRVIDPERNGSRSFRVFISGVRFLVGHAA